MPYRQQSTDQHYTTNSQPSSARGVPTSSSIVHVMSGQAQRIPVYDAQSHRARKIDDHENHNGNELRGHTLKSFSATAPQPLAKGHKNRLLSVVCLSVSIATFLISLTVAVVLATSVVYSLQAADDFAQRYSRSSVVAATATVNEFVVIPVNAYTAMARATEYGYYPNLVNGSDFSSIDTNNNTNLTALAKVSAVRETMYLRWLNGFHQIYFEANFKLLYVAAGLADNSFLACNLYHDPSAAVLHECTFNDPTNVTHRNLNLNNYYSLEIFYHNSVSLNFSERWQYWSYTTSVYNPIRRPWYTNAPQGLGEKPIFSEVYVDYVLAFPIVDVNGPLYAGDGTFLGVTSISLDLREISTSLSEIPQTPNALTILIDGDGYLLGASDLGDLSRSTPYNASTDGPIKYQCVYYESKAGVISQVCRLTPENYAHKELNSLYKLHPHVFANDGAFFTDSYRIDGEQWMVSKAQIEAKTDLTVAVIDWQMISIMPVRDVTGPIVKGRNVGIAIACAMVLASCVACGLALYVLLSPLSALSKLMEKASELRDEGIRNGVRQNKSKLWEIRTIQDAFERLSVQLQRAKSFLPASLLVQLETTDEDEYDEDDEGEGGIWPKEDGSRRHDDDDDDEGSLALDTVKVSRLRKGGGGGGDEYTSDYSSSGIASNRSSSVTGRTHTTTNLQAGSSRGGSTLGFTRTASRQPRPNYHHQQKQHREGQNSQLILQVQKQPSSSAMMNPLVSKSVTIAALNFRRFHQTVASDVNLDASYAAMIDSFTNIARECRGILDSFHGDRFFFTFNAARPCLGHAVMGVTAMLKITESIDLQKRSKGIASNRKKNRAQHHQSDDGAHPLPLIAKQQKNRHSDDEIENLRDTSISCGVASGRCLVGNMGSERSRRFATVGLAFSHAALLERLSKRYPRVTVLVAEETAAECEALIDLVLVDLIAAPIASKGGRRAALGDFTTSSSGDAALQAMPVVVSPSYRPCLVAAALRTKHSSTAGLGKARGGKGHGARVNAASQSDQHRKADEWMYEVGQVDETCDYFNCNSAFRSALAGDVTAARGYLQSFATTGRRKKEAPTRWAERRIQSLISAVEEDQHGLVISNTNVHAKTAPPAGAAVANDEPTKTSQKNGNGHAFSSAGGNKKSRTRRDLVSDLGHFYNNCFLDLQHIGEQKPIGHPQDWIDDSESDDEYEGISGESDGQPKGMAAIDVFEGNKNNTGGDCSDDDENITYIVASATP